VAVEIFPPESMSSGVSGISERSDDDTPLASAELPDGLALFLGFKGLSIAYILVMPAGEGWWGLFDGHSCSSTARSTAIGIRGTDIRDRATWFNN
jgi:hypothetical protein